MATQSFFYLSSKTFSVKSIVMHYLMECALKSKQLKRMALGQSDENYRRLKGREPLLRCYFFHNRLSLTKNGSKLDISDISKISLAIMR